MSEVARLARSYLRRLFDGLEGFVALGIAFGPHLDEKGAYAHRSFSEAFWVWPDQADPMIAEAEKYAYTADVYVCPVLRTERSRRKGRGGLARYAYADLDGEPPAGWSRALLGPSSFVIGSGNGKHPYVWLPEPTPATELEQLNRRLAIALGADAGWSETKYLRLPGTLNHKPRVRGVGEAVLVRQVQVAVVEHDLTRAELEQLLPELPPEEDIVHAGGEPAWPVGLPPLVAARLREVAGPDNDRSAMLHSLVGLCVREGLSDDEIVAVAQQHRPTVEKYGHRAVTEIRRSIQKHQTVLPNESARTGDMGTRPETPDEPVTALGAIPDSPITALVEAESASSASGLGEPLPPFALTLDEFIAAKSKHPPTLLGDADETILPAVGCVLLFGRGGRGKTTLSVDAALHLASGVDWLGLHLERPLRILVIENEGPRELFRGKLERKRSHWPHPIPGAIFIYAESWGAFTLSDTPAIERLRAFNAENRVDLVIGDPLDTLGVAGVGSPEEIRAFVALMVEAGLNRDVAFWLLHHPRKERTEDELDEAAGAWGGKPDTVLRIDAQPGNRARLSFPKVRWSRRNRRPALILAFDPEAEDYSVVSEEGDERDLTAEIKELLADGVWRTVKEIAAPKGDVDKPGVGASAVSVKSTLEENPEQFVTCTGEDAVALGRSGKAVVWQLRSQGPDHGVGELTPSTLWGVSTGETDATESRPQSSIEDVTTESVRPVPRRN